jgi:hypothetical protein
MKLRKSQQNTLMLHVTPSNQNWTNFMKNYVWGVSATIHCLNTILFIYFCIQCPAEHQKQRNYTHTHARARAHTNTRAHTHTHTQTHTRTRAHTSLHFPISLIMLSTAETMYHQMMG